MIHSQSNAVSLWEVAYHDAWYHYQALFLDILTTLNKPDFSFEDRKLVIGKLGQLTLRVYKIERTGLTMYERVPGCQTVLKEPIGYFASAFPRRCLHLLRTLHMLTQGLMSNIQNDREIYRTIFMLDSRINGQRT